MLIEMKTEWRDTSKMPTITHEARIYEMNGKTVVGIVDDLQEHKDIFAKWGMMAEVDVFQQGFTFPRKLGMYADVHNNNEDRIQYVIGFDVDVATALLDSEVDAIMIFDSNGTWLYAMAFVHREEWDKVIRLHCVTDSTLDLMGVKKNRTHL